MYQAALSRAAAVENVLQKEMKYCDLHCDALTQEGVLQVTKQNLIAGGCFLQCFAAFVSAREGRFSQALALADQFDELCVRESYNPVTRYSDLRKDKINVLFTVEEGGAAEGSLAKIEALYSRGARMMTLVWNYPNEIGFPNFPDYEALCAGKVSPERRETGRGLTEFGFRAVEKMNALGMIVDVSHGSDKLFYDVVSASKKPFVASHSGAASVCAWARNLTDKQTKTLSECGGVVGLDFCADFTSPDKSAEGQRTALLAHARAIVNAGGEDVLAIGSDFDGIPENPYLKNPAYIPAFLEELEREFGSAAAEKFAFKNALRVLKDNLTA